MRFFAEVCVSHSNTLSRIGASSLSVGIDSGLDQALRLANQAAMCRTYKEIEQQPARRISLCLVG